MSEDKKREILEFIKTEAEKMRSNTRLRDYPLSYIEGIAVKFNELMGTVFQIPGAYELVEEVGRSPHHLSIYYRLLTESTNREGVLIEGMSKTLNIPESTTRRILKSFHKKGLVEYMMLKEGGGKNGPKPRLWRLTR